MTNEEINKLLEQSEKIIQSAHDNMYFYFYEEYRRVKHKRIQKRAFPYYGCDPKVREMALIYADMRRKIHSYGNGKFYNQVSLVNYWTGKCYIICGGTWNENMFGLAWEAELLKILPNKKSKLNINIYNIPILIDNELCYYPGFTKENSFIPFDKDSQIPKQDYFPVIFVADLEKTINYKRLKNGDYNDHGFRKETILFNKKLRKSNNKSFPKTHTDN